MLNLKNRELKTIADVITGHRSTQMRTMKDRHVDDEDDLAVDNAPVRDAADSKADVEFMALRGQGTGHCMTDAHLGPRHAEA